MPFKDKEKKRAYLQKWRQKWAIESRCVDCGHPERTEDKVRCISCQSKLEASNALKEERLKNGICRCGRPLDILPIKRCSYCRNKTLSRYWESYGEKRKQKQKEERNRLINAYGGICNCCGEAEPLFLQVDHINNDGYKDKNRRSLLVWLRNQGYPKDNYQLLCANCNWGKRLNGGICPHATK